MPLNRMEDHGRDAAVEVEGSGDEGGLLEAVLLQKEGDNNRHNHDAEGGAGGHEAVGEGPLGSEVVRDDGEGQG